MVASRILDLYGNPIQMEVLAEPQTSKVGWLNREFDNHPSRGLTPARLARILDAAELGDARLQHELFLDMEEKDGHIFADMSKRKHALLTVEWDIVPPRNASAAEKKQAGYAKEMIQDIDNFEDVILDALDGIGHGFSFQEIEWELLGSEWIPKQITQRPQTWFKTDYETRTKLNLRDNTLDGQELWEFGWIRHVHKAKSGYIARAGLHRTLVWPYMFKNYSIGDLAEFLEIYGLPLRLGKYPAGSSDDEKSTLLRAVMSIGHDAAGIIPENMSIDFIEAAKVGADPFTAMTEWCERTTSKCILGGTLTSQADGKTSTNALGKIHNEVRHDLTVSDAAQLNGTFTADLVYPLLALNMGGVTDRRRCPKFKFNVSETADLALLADALPKLVAAGMLIPVQWAHEQGGIPMAEDGEAILVVANPPATLPHNEQPVNTAAASAVAALIADSTGTARRAPTAPLDLADQLAAESADAWAAVLAHVTDLVNHAESLESLQTDLLNAYGRLPLAELRKVMAQGYQVAVLAGMADVGSPSTGTARRAPTQ
jgi:phage gp29-like protein